MLSAGEKQLNAGKMEHRTTKTTLSGDKVKVGKEIAYQSWWQRQWDGVLRI